MVRTAAGRHSGTTTKETAVKIRIVLALAALTLVGVACTAPEPDTLGVKSFDGATTDETTQATTPTAAASTCDVVREALLTGSPAEIKTAMAALKADTAADATAREYADNYLTETNADLQEMNVSILRMYCD
jgi:hypothetical protein